MSPNFCWSWAAALPLSGQQVPAAGRSDKEFFIDLLFYHTRLKCHVVVELKATEPSSPNMPGS
jgi:hypothetical protein